MSRFRLRITDTEKPKKTGSENKKKKSTHLKMKHILYTLSKLKIPKINKKINFLKATFKV